jgi:hypothetical protein
MALRTLRLLAALSIAVYALPAQAVPVRMQFGGELDSAFGLDGMFAGDAWSLDILYDTDAPDLAPEASQGFYAYQLLSMQVGALSLVPDSARSPGLILARDNFQFPTLPGTFWNGITVTGAIGNDLGAPLPEFLMQVVRLCAVDPCNPSFGTTTLPQSGEAFVTMIDELIAGSANVTFLIAAPFASGPPLGLAAGTLTSWRSIAVSEPGAALWWGIALVAAGWLIRRRGVTEASRDPVA